MFVGKVIGTVWSTVKWPQVQGLKLLVVRPYHLADLAERSDLPPDRGPAETSASRGPSPKSAIDPAPAPFGGPDSEAVVCVDLLDAGVGDDVVVAFGHAARVAAQLAQGEPLAPSREDRGIATKGKSFPESSRASTSPGAVVPIDAAVVAIVDSIRVAPR